MKRGLLLLAVAPTLWAPVGCATTTSVKDHAAAEVHYDIAVESMKHDDMRGALRDLLAAENKDPRLPQVQNALGLTYHALGRLDEALKHYHEAVKLKPDFSSAYNNMGTLLTDLGRYDDAIAAFKQALTNILYPTPSLAEGNMGWAYYQKGDTDKALRHLRNAVATNPKFCRGYEWLARIDLAINKPDGVVHSIEHFRKYCMADHLIAKTIAPQYVHQMTYYLALGYLKQGNRDAARKAFSQCAVAGADSGFEAKCAASLASLQ